MTQQHSTIATADRHYGKDQTTAAASAVYVVAAAGGDAGSWIQLSPHGSVAFVNLAAPNTVSTPDVYTKIAPTTTASGSPIEVTEATTARLTYTGARIRHAQLNANLSVSCSAARNLTFSIYRNGAIVALSECITAVAVGERQMISLFADITSLTLNDYFEVFVVRSGATGPDVLVYSYNINLIALL